MTKKLHLQCLLALQHIWLSNSVMDIQPLLEFCISWSRQELLAHCVCFVLASKPCLFVVSLACVSLTGLPAPLDTLLRLCLELQSTNFTLRLLLQLPLSMSTWTRGTSVPKQTYSSIVPSDTSPACLQPAHLSPLGVSCLEAVPLLPFQRHTAASPSAALGIIVYHLSCRFQAEAERDSQHGPCLIAP